MSNTVAGSRQRDNFPAIAKNAMRMNIARGLVSQATDGSEIGHQYLIVGSDVAISVVHHPLM